MSHFIFSFAGLSLYLPVVVLGAALVRPASAVPALQTSVPTGLLKAAAIDISAATLPTQSQQSQISRNSLSFQDPHDPRSSQDSSIRPPGFLRCLVTYGGTTRTLDTYPGTDAYTVEPVDIDGRFLFKAVVRSSAGQVDAVKLYVYQAASPRPVLLHEARYLPPFAPSGAIADKAADTAVNGQASELIPGLYRSLTGEHTVIALPLERQLQFGCAWMGGQ